MRLNIIWTIFFLCLFGSSVVGQVQGPPNAKKNKPLLKVNDLGFSNVWTPDPKTLGIQIARTAPTPSFTVRIWIQYKGRRTRTFYERKVPAINNTDGLIEVIFSNLDHLLGAEVGVFVDSKNDIPEKDEKNCTRITAEWDFYPNQTCTNFGKEK